MLTKVVFWNSKVFAPMGHIAIERFSSGFVSGVGGDPNIFAGGLCSRKDRGCIIEIFYVRNLREMLLCINLDVVHCLEWIDVG